MSEEDLMSPLEQQALRLVQMGRHIASEILSSDLTANSRQGALLDRCLGRLSSGQPLLARDAGGYQAVHGILKREVEAETVKIAWEFDGIHDPESGDVGTVRKIRIVTERGEFLSSLLAAFERFLAARQDLLDRLSVDSALAGAIRA